MATVVLNSKITIAGFKPFKGVNDVRIKKSLDNYNDNCTITLPATARMKLSERAQADSVLTARQFKRGDKVVVELGYDGSLKTEFVGFISRVNLTTPVELECEGYAYQLREKQVNKLWKNTTLKDVLKEVIVGTDIVLGEVDNVPLSVLRIEKQSGFDALATIKKAVGYACNIWFDGNVLHAGLKYYFFSDRNQDGRADVYYHIGHNTVRDNDMKERQAGDTKEEIVLYNQKKDGSKTTATAGTPNSNYNEKKIQAIADEKTLKKMAESVEKTKNYAGLEGSLTAFLQPMCRPGYKAAIKDSKYAERSGNYLVDAVETRYGTGGARRKVSISFKL